MQCLAQELQATLRHATRQEIAAQDHAFERFARSSIARIGLHRLMHAGEIGGPEKIREASNSWVPSESATVSLPLRIPR